MNVCCWFFFPSSSQVFFRATQSASNKKWRVKVWTQVRTRISAKNRIKELSLCAWSSTLSSKDTLGLSVWFLYYGRAVSSTGHNRKEKWQNPLACLSQAHDSIKAVSCLGPKQPTSCWGWNSPSGTATGTPWYWKTAKCQRHLAQLLWAGWWSFKFCPILNSLF